MSTPLGRRPFIGTLASLAGMAAVAPASGLAATRGDSRSESPATPGRWDLSWLDALEGKHRQGFAAGGGGPVSMAVATNWLDAHEEVFGLKPPTVDAFIGTSVRAFPINCSDRLRAKYGCTDEQLG